MSKWPKQVYSIRGSSSGNYTVTGIIGCRMYHNTKEREAVKIYIRECNGEPVKLRSSAQNDRRKREKFMRYDESYEF